MELTYTDVLGTMVDQYNNYRSNMLSKKAIDVWQLANQVCFVQKIIAFYEDAYYSDDEDLMNRLLEVVTYDILTLYEYYCDEDPSNYNIDNADDVEELIANFAYWYGGD